MVKIRKKIAVQEDLEINISSKNAFVPTLRPGKKNVSVVVSLSKRSESRPSHFTNPTM